MNKKMRLTFIILCACSIYISVSCGSGWDSRAYASPVLPLLYKSDLVYKGAFRVPKGNLGGTSLKGNSLSGGGSGLTFNPANNSLILSGIPSEKMIVEISIPTIVNSTNISELKTATLIQAPIDPTSGNWDKLKADRTAIGNGGAVGGFAIYNGKLIGTSFAWFDGGNAAYYSHFTSNLNWDTGSGFKGMYRVGNHPTTPGTNSAGFVAGSMSLIPTEWQADFGGPYLTGASSNTLSVASRTSLGPSAYVFNPGDLGVKDPVPATPLVMYPISQPALGTFTIGPSSPGYNMGTRITGLVFPSGTSSVLFTGVQGMGPNCYGVGTSDPKLAGTYPVGAPDPYCYDPTSNIKENHAYPYVSYVWAYDAKDLLAVKNGQIKPWEVKPYAMWTVELPFAISAARLSGAAYDPVSKRIFITQKDTDKPTVEPFPLIHVFEVKGVSPKPPTNLTVAN